MNKLTWLLLLLAWIILGLWLSNKYLCNQQNSVATVTPTEEQTKTKTVAPVVTNSSPEKTAVTNGWKGAWAFSDNDFKASSPEYFQYLKSKFTPFNLKDNVNLNNALNATATYLKANPKRSLSITGYYNETEKNPSILPNLGLARANTIKDKLKALGVPSAQMSLLGEKTDLNFFVSDTLKRGVDFSFGELASNTDRITQIKSRLQGKPLTLYFGTNQDNINLTAEQRQDVSDLIYYIDNVAGSKLNISGHTDATGDKNYNINLSKQRADFVEQYLKRNGGINLDRMDTQGFGPNKPIATNATSEGRAKNRRVEVTLN